MRYHFLLAVQCQQSGWRVGAEGLAATEAVGLEPAPRVVNGRYVVAL